MASGIRGCAWHVNQIWEAVNAAIPALGQTLVSACDGGEQNEGAIYKGSCMLAMLARSGWEALPIINGVDKWELICEKWTEAWHCFCCNKCAAGRR